MIDNDEDLMYNVRVRDGFGTRVKIFETTEPHADVEALQAIAEWVRLENIYVESITHHVNLYDDGGSWLVVYV